LRLKHAVLIQRQAVAPPFVSDLFTRGLLAAVAAAEAVVVRAAVAADSSAEELWKFLKALSEHRISASFPPT